MESCMRPFQFRALLSRKHPELNNRTTFRAMFLIYYDAWCSGRDHGYDEAMIDEGRY